MAVLGAIRRVAPSPSQTAHGRTQKKIPVLPAGERYFLSAAILLANFFKQKRNLIRRKIHILMTDVIHGGAFFLLVICIGRINLIRREIHAHDRLNSASHQITFPPYRSYIKAIIIYTMLSVTPTPLPKTNPPEHAGHESLAEDPEHKKVETHPTH